MGSGEGSQLKIIIAGSRGLEVDDDRLYTWVDWAARSCLERDWELSDIEIVSGGEPTGIDACGERFSRGVLKKEPRVFPANWKKYGKAAGPLRNKEMALYADAALVFLREPTPGSSNMATWMLLLEKPVKVLTCR